MAGFNFDGEGSVMLRAFCFDGFVFGNVESVALGIFLQRALGVAFGWRCLELFQFWKKNGLKNFLGCPCAAIHPGGSDDSFYGIGQVGSALCAAIFFFAVA